MSVIAVSVANGLADWSINNLYGLYFKNAAYISVLKVEENSLRHIVEIALANNEVQIRLAYDKGIPSVRYLNYILPTGMYVSEIPMNEVKKIEGHHFMLRGYSEDLYKIIFTKAETRTNDEVQGKEILLKTVARTPILEVHIDLNQHQVVKIMDPPVQLNYESIPMPLF